MEMEDCWELSKGLSLCIDRLSCMSRSKEFSVLEWKNLHRRLYVLFYKYVLMEEGPSDFLTKFVDTQVLSTPNQK